MTKKPQDIKKKNQSSIQVLKTLGIMLQGNYTMSELIQKLNEQENESIFNNSVISKYINTCRRCGIDIVKIHNRYFVTEMPFGIKLLDDEIELLQELKETITEAMSLKSHKIFQKFIDKLNRYTDKKLTRIEKNNFAFSIETFEKALNMKRKIKLLFKTKNEICGIPITITKEKGSLLFHIYSAGKVKTISSERLSGMEVLNEPFLDYMDTKSVVYKLKGDLAKRYKLREEEEQMLDSSFEDNIITISNKSKNWEALLLRLMRYDNLCEVMTPVDVRNQMETMIDDTLKNYGIN